MTKLNEIFEKSIERHIQGVIKADDEADFRNEFDEYVLTNEVAKNLETFLDAYNDYRGNNGVWISGFFGSGKSHLLKILASLLKGQEIGGDSSLKLFLTKCSENAILRGGLEKAVSIPSESILFNIDQKADVISKNEPDALLSVFAKVFDEMCGYYGKQGYISNFERDLDDREIYHTFQEAYRSISGKSWQEGRKESLLESSNIDKAFAQATSQGVPNVENVLDKYRNDYSLSVEDFANLVNRYIERQAPGFRLNFFVDEVGQFVAGNIQLMTNLQTIAESLATKCRGKAWLFITAQEDMDTVLGASEQQTNDFSKIQDRFAIRMKLTSTDVAEVIKARLLNKRDYQRHLVSALYHDHCNNFKTLFGFADGPHRYRNFEDEEDFIRCYPFVPYQFELFQLAIRNLSTVQAFEGKHSSVGERSMLSVFQRAVIKLKDGSVGCLASFDLMFEGIRQALKSHTKQAVLDAERSLGDEFAIRVLKALLLVKYVKEFTPTAANIEILVAGQFGRNLQEASQRMESALSLLEQQTYIQRNGDRYEYLTDEEVDIEKQIKATEIDASEVTSELQKIVFEEIIIRPKIRYEDNGQDYPYTRRFDGKLFGRDHELTIHIISPLGEESGSETEMKMKSLEDKQFIVQLPEDSRLVQDIGTYKRTAKYIRQNISGVQQTESGRRILSEKQDQNKIRRNNLERLVKSLLCQSGLFVGGDKIEIASEDAQVRIESGFQRLITRTYPNLKFLSEIYTESDIAKHLNTSSDELFQSDAPSLPESEQDVLSTIVGYKSQGVRITVKQILEKYGRAPYGWYYAATLCTIAKLCARNKIEARLDSNLLERDELGKALCNSHKHNNLIIEPQTQFSSEQIIALEQFIEQFFEKLPDQKEAKALGTQAKLAFEDLLTELHSMREKIGKYPFGQKLDSALTKIEECTGKSHAWYLTELVKQQQDLIDLKGSVIAPIKSFLGGPQVGIYDGAIEFERLQNSNFEYLDDCESSELTNKLKDPEILRGDGIRQVKLLVESLKAKIETQRAIELDEGDKKIQELANRIFQTDRFKELSAEEREKIESRFSGMSEAIQLQSLIAVIRDKVRNFIEIDSNKILQSLDAGNSNVRSAEAEKASEYVPIQTVKVTFEKPWLSAEADVNDYLERLREAIIGEIKQGKRIRL